jgi:hypothetical protein
MSQTLDTPGTWTSASARPLPAAASLVSKDLLSIIDSVLCIKLQESPSHLRSVDVIGKASKKSICCRRRTRPPRSESGNLAMLQSQLYRIGWPFSLSVTRMLTRTYSLRGTIIVYGWHQEMRTSADPVHHDSNLLPVPA